jgi:hypothetical protein
MEALAASPARLGRRSRSRKDPSVMFGLRANVHAHMLKAPIDSSARLPVLVGMGERSQSFVRPLAVNFRLEVERG